MKVQFRTFPEGDVVALFPEIQEAPGRVQSYQRLGQHAPADQELLTVLRPSLPEEYTPLLHELQGIYRGETLEVVP